MRQFSRLAFAAVIAAIFLGGTSEGATPTKPLSPLAIKLLKYRSPVIMRNALSTFTWTMPQLCAAYNFPKSQTGGSVIGIAEFGGGYTQNDLTLFSNTYMNGTPINITAVSVDGTLNSPGDPNVDAEVALDIQIAAAAYYYSTGKAPTVKVFFCSSGFSNDDFANNNAKVINAAAAAGCDVLSISWGVPEEVISTAVAQNLETAATNATKAGMAVFASSGDGDATNERQGETDGKNHLILPASCPHVIAVGGTTKLPTSEVVWNNGLTLGTPYPLGTGGGYSILFPVQSFQIGAPVAPATNNGKGRMVPDVAANADPNTPYEIALDGTIQAAGNGTSAACPLWAGLISALRKKPGFISPTLWLPANRSTAFVDITSGNNILFRAAVGPDACTGLGVMNGKGVAAVFQPPPPPPPPKVPSNVTATYVAGTKTLTLTGDVNANSLTVSYSGGTLKVEGANATKINNSATAFTATHSGQLVLVANLSDGDDALSLVGINASSATIDLGNGADKAAFTLSNIGTLTINGGAGTDVLLTTSTVIGSVHESSIP